MVLPSTDNSQSAKSESRWISI